LDEEGDEYRVFEMAAIKGQVRRLGSKLRDITQSTQWV
jgi:hypothetical protein